MQKDPLFRTTLFTALAMVAACMVFVGSLSLVAVFVTSRVVGSDSDSAKTGSAALAPAAKS